MKESAKQQYSASKKIAAPLVTIMLMQGQFLPDQNNVNRIKNEVKRNQEMLTKNKSESIEKELDETMLCALKEAKQKGASSWLTVLPLEEYNFVLSKAEFRDAINLRYGKNLRGLPSKCPYGQNYNVNHALNCKKGRFVINRHNNIRDFKANLLKKVHNDVEIEPMLQPINGEVVNGIAGDNARSDIRARGVWCRGQNAFFDVRVTNTNADSQKHLSTEKILEKHEKEKKRQYNQRIMNVEQWNLHTISLFNKR